MKKLIYKKLYGEIRKQINNQSIYLQLLEISGTVIGVLAISIEEGSKALEQYISDSSIPMTDDVSHFCKFMFKNFRRRCGLLAVETEGKLLDKEFTVIKKGKGKYPVCLTVFHGDTLLRFEELPNSHIEL